MRYIPTLIARFLVLVALMTPSILLADDAAPTGVSAKASAFYVGGGANTVFREVMTLPDGTFLVGGGSDSLDWLPRSVQRQQLPSADIAGQPGGGRVAFVLHVSADLQRVVRAVAFEPGAASDVRRLRCTGLPGSNKIGDLLLSVTTQESREGQSGYAIVKLKGNFSDPAPLGVEWVRNVWAGRDHREIQPWDVGSDGKVVYALGVDYAPDWVAIQRLTADGKDDVVEHWRYHMGLSAEGTKVAGHWTPASSREGVRVSASAVVFKISRPDLRSWTAEDYNAIEDDGNGKPRQGRWPDDLFFGGPGSPDDSGASGRGYTGYSPGKNATHRIGALTIDRRDNSIYVGFSIQSRLPDGLPDFEPAVIAWDSDGKMRWWSRLYHQTPQNSPPDQYIDALAVHYRDNRLVVGARSHGNNTVNLWDGNNSFKNKLNGKTGNVHISWLGTLDLKSGKFVNSAWVSELADVTKGLGKPIASGKMAGWPDPNGGWADMNTTLLRGLAVDPVNGNILALGTGRRPYTTSDAYQAMPKPGEGMSAWSDFARAYTADFSGLDYSSVLNAQRDPNVAGQRAIELSAITSAAGGNAIVVVGKQAPKLAETMATRNGPDWASTDATGAAVIALMPIAK